MKAQLCICNNCDAIMVDNNPAEQPEFETTKLHLFEMVNVQEGDWENFWGCPNCLTDAYLSDVVEQEQIDRSINN